MYASLCNVFSNKGCLCMHPYVMYFLGINIFNSLTMYHYIFLILLQYVTGYTPFRCPYSFCCCIKFVLNFILFLKLRKLHLSFHLLKV